MDKLLPSDIDKKLLIREHESFLRWYVLSRPGVAIHKEDIEQAEQAWQAIQAIIEKE